MSITIGAGIHPGPRKDLKVAAALGRRRRRVDAIVRILGLVAMLVGLSKPVQICSLGSMDTDIVNIAALAAYDVGR